MRPTRRASTALVHRGRSRGHGAADLRPLAAILATVLLATSSMPAGAAPGRPPPPPKEVRPGDAAPAFSLSVLGGDTFTYTPPGAAGGMAPPLFVLRYALDEAVAPLLVTSTAWQVGRCEGLPGPPPAAAAGHSSGWARMGTVDSGLCTCRCRQHCVGVPLSPVSVPRT